MTEVRTPKGKLYPATVVDIGTDCKWELDLRSCVIREQVEPEISKFIEIDNNCKRLHSSPAYKLPEYFELASMKSKKPNPKEKYLKTHP